MDYSLSPFLVGPSGGLIGRLSRRVAPSLSEILDVIAKIIAITDCVAWSTMEWTIFSLVNICWPRFSLFWETKGIIGHENLEDVFERLRQWGVRLPLQANWAFRSVIAWWWNIVVLGLRLRS